MCFIYGLINIFAENLVDNLLQDDRESVSGLCEIEDNTLAHYYASC
jgi:hypothetical protein